LAYPLQALAHLSRDRAFKHGNGYLSPKGPYLPFSSEGWGLVRPRKVRLPGAQSESVVSDGSRPTWSLRTWSYSRCPLSTIPMSIGKSHRSNLPSDLPMIAKGATRPPTRRPWPSTTPWTTATPASRRGTHKIRFATHFIPLPTRIPNLSYLWACTPVQKKVSRHLHSNLERLYLLEQKISAGDGFSRNRALAGSCR
jgi:hypothetical protein